MTVLEQISEAIAGMREGFLEPTIRERLAIHVLDTVGAWVAGRAIEDGAILSRLHSAPPRPVGLFRGDPLDSLAAGVATTRFTEIDDIHRLSCTTPGSVVVPTALILAAAMRPPTVKSFAPALCAGYEMMTRFGASFAGAKLVYQGIWPTYLAAPLGASAVAARILGLDTCKTTNALSIALTMISGAPGGPAAGISPRWMLLGLAARSGCTAALAAAVGYGGDHNLLDSDWLIRTHGIDFNPGPLLATDPYGQAFSALSLKPYCAAKQCIAAIDAFRDALTKGISPNEIARVRVYVPPAYAEMIANPPAGAGSGRLARITSVAYHLALAAFRPDALDEIARPDLVSHSAIAEFMTRVEIVADETLAPYYPERWPARVEVVLHSGRAVSVLVLDAPGDPARLFNMATAQQKFHRLVDPVLGAAAADALAVACLGATEHDDKLAALCAAVIDT